MPSRASLPSIVTGLLLQEGELPKVPLGYYSSLILLVSLPLTGQSSANLSNMPAEFFINTKD